MATCILNGLIVAAIEYEQCAPRSAEDDERAGVHRAQSSRNATPRDADYPGTLRRYRQDDA